MRKRIYSEMYRNNRELRNIKNDKLMLPSGCIVIKATSGRCDKYETCALKLECLEQLLNWRGWKSVDDRGYIPTEKNYGT